ncbi:DUF6778 family protein [Thalassovita aquimarina]|uniref:Lipoprotein n=1 Tax=Thalassovita aquimarina TaxID=2785917 RepID=A0ABS5HW84_9RHOB|nr:DUF6778 family protein [Thalassovita aquimarina]MBR9653232.1 hypothetical protein [Thalassovita aquimarina]
MKKIRTGIILAIGLGLSACASVDTASRNIPLEAPQMLPAAPVVALADYNIKVSRSLRVSEANMYYPMGDIVWRGDAMGDRHEQVARIFQDSLIQVQQQNQQGALPVVVDIDLLRFHALTEKTRYTIGGVHSIAFNMTVRNPVTGEVIVPTYEVKADLRGYGGSKALAAEQQGLTQKLRITRHLANVITQELAASGSAPKGVTELVAGLETAAQG